MGILHESVTRIKTEKEQLQQRLELLNVRSTGRDRVVKRLHELDNELRYINQSETTKSSVI